MTEANRQHYLRAMGIPVWYARCKLPGAKAAETADFSGFAGESLPAVSTSQASAKFSPKTPVLASNTSELATKKPAASLATVTRLVTSSAEEGQVGANVHPGVIPLSKAQDASVAFTVRVFQLGALIVINSAHPDTDSQRDYALLANVGMAWPELGDNASPIHEFVWPPFSNKRLPEQHGTMAQDLFAKLLRVPLVNARAMLILGELPPWKLPDHGCLTSLSAVAGSELSSLPLIRSWSLGDLLLTPRLKIDLWRHIQLLVKAL